MSPKAGKSIAFIGKSMLWSLLLYAVMMLTFNWEEVNNTIKGKNAVTIITNTLSSPVTNEPYTIPATISAATSKAGAIISILRDLGGLVKAIQRN